MQKRRKHVLSYLAVNNRMLPEYDDLSGRRNHKGGSHRTRVLSIRLQALRERSISVDALGSIPWAMSPIDTVAHCSITGSMSEYGGVVCQYKLSGKPSSICVQTTSGCVACALG